MRADELDAFVENYRDYATRCRPGWITNTCWRYLLGDTPSALEQSHHWTDESVAIVQRIANAISKDDLVEPHQIIDSQRVHIVAIQANCASADVIEFAQMFEHWKEVRHGHFESTHIRMRRRTLIAFYSTVTLALAVGIALGFVVSALMYNK